MNYRNSVDDVVQIYLKPEEVNLTKHSVVMKYQSLFKVENKTVELPALLFKQV